MTLFAENAKDNKCICESFIEKNKIVFDLEKEKCELLGIIQGKDKAIADLKKENARMRELLKTLSESIVMTADDVFWSLKEDVEKFFGGEEYEEHQTEEM